MDPELLIHEQADLTILEAPDGDGVFNPDGTVNMVLIRPCNGRGPYNNIYEADMLRQNAAAFKGYPMFDGHDSPAARKARNFLPRTVSELAGAVRESWFDDDYATPEDAKHGFDQGAVVGKCALTDAMEALVRKIPEAVKGSLNAMATSKRRGQRKGASGWIVEGFVNDPENGSFDLVTKAGAGGRVRSVLESLYDAGNATDGLATALEGVGDESLVAFLREHRPDVLEGGEMNLQEALQSDEVKGYIGQMIADGVQAGIQEALPTAIETRENDIRETIREEIGQNNRLRGLHGEAKGIIEAAKGLTATAKNNLLADYGLEENDDETVSPGRSLALIEAVVDGEGAVTKSAKAVLSERLEADIKSYRDVISEAGPTIPQARVSGAGGQGSGGFGGKGSAWAERARKRGLDPSQFGAPKPEPAKAAATTE